MLLESDRADVERRLRIRKRNLTRLEQEVRDAKESEAPPVVVERLQAQARVEREEIRLLQARLTEMEGRGRQKPVGPARRPDRLSSKPSWWLRVMLAVFASGVLLGVAALVFPHSPRGTTLLGAPPTNTPAPTYTPVPPTPTVTPTSTPRYTPTATPVPATPTPTATPTSSLPIGTVNVAVLNFRSGPGTNYSIRSKVFDGDRLTVSGKNSTGDWLAVITADGANGWVAAEYVTLSVDVESLPIREATE